MREVQDELVNGDVRAGDIEPNGTMTEVDAQRVVETGTDFLIEVLAAVAQRGAEVGVTLNVRGAVVTGVLIGRSAWLQEQVAMLSSAGSGAEVMGQSLNSLFTSLYGDGQDGDDIRYAFIHLKEARYVFGEGFAPSVENSGFLWRGRISEVSAWSIGSLTRRV